MLDTAQYKTKLQILRQEYADRLLALKKDLSQKTGDKPKNRGQTTVYA